MLQPSAKLVRLLFHDCVTGCDGCLDLGNPENNGLGEIYQEVNTLYNSQFSNTGMSRADFIALQAVVAIRVAADEPDCMQLQLPPGCNNTDKPKPTMFIRYGRRDCATSPNSTNDFGFPDAHRGHAHVMQVFRDGMGMTERQVVALIGAHTLGRTTPQNSGFQGPWAPPEDHFDNGFYRSLVNENWRQHELNLNGVPAGFNPRYQWDNFMRTNQPPPRGSRMMLNTDMVCTCRHVYLSVYLCLVIMPAPTPKTYTYTIHMLACVRVCVCVCARASVCVCVCECR